MNIGTALTQVKNLSVVKRVADGVRPALNVAVKHGPEILTGIGIVGGATTVVLGARATLKLEPIIDEAKDRLDTIDELDEEPRERAKDKARVYLETAGKVGKLYLPTVGVGLLSAGSILTAHNLLHKRNLALIAAYKVMEGSYNSLRERVGEEVGEDKLRDFERGIREETKTEDGKKKTVASFDPAAGISGYARFFDETSSISWVPEADYNLIFLRAQQSFANDLLLRRGYVTLNDVYKGLGMETTDYGQVVGWVMGGDGDNYIDFGIYDQNNPKKRQFVNGQENVILLDFNVDGTILDKIEIFKRR